MFSNKTTLLLLGSILFVILFLTGIFSDGMFFDGVVYASVARNFAVGDGTFWDLHYTKTLYYGYHEQPSFTFFLQSLFYRVLGTGIYVERVYCFLFACGWIFIIGKIFFLFTKEKNSAFLPVILWMTIPVIHWTFHNNMQEVTMGFFALCAVYFSLYGLLHDKLICILLASVFTFLASFCKGLQALFPIITPVLFYITYRTVSLKRTFINQCLISIVPVCMYVLFYLYQPARTCYTLYIQRRLFSTFQNEMDTTTFRFQILYDLVQQLLIPVIIALALLLLTKTKKISLSKYASFMFLLGLSASVPLMVTLEQRPFYLSPSIPLFIFALATFVNKPFQEVLLVLQRNQKIMKGINIVLSVLLLLSIVFLFFNPNNPKRERELLHDIGLIKPIIPEGSVISVSENLYHQYHLHAYMNRYGLYSMGVSDTSMFYLCRKDEMAVNAAYKKVEVDLLLYNMYAKNYH